MQRNSSDPWWSLYGLDLVNLVGELIHLAFGQIPLIISRYIFDVLQAAIRKCHFILVGISSLGRWCMSIGIHQNARTQDFPSNLHKM